MSNKKILKIYVYDKKGKLVAEYLQSQFVKILMDVVDHNITYEEDQWNIIHGFEFPPYEMKWDPDVSDWIEIKKQIINKNEQLGNFIKSFGI